MSFDDGRAQSPDATFDQILGGVDSPMWIVTASGDGERSGCLVGFASQCSIDPPRFTAWVSKNNHTHRVATAANSLAVHLLRRGTRHLAKLFGETTGDEVDKFASCRWYEGPDGAAILEGCDWFVGRVLLRIDGGDHTGFLLEPCDAGRYETDQPQLGLQDVRDLTPGHEA